MTRERLIYLCWALGSLLVMAIALGPSVNMFVTAMMSDAITVLLDPGRSERRAMNFTVNARATQADRISSSFGDGASQWDGEWESAAVLDANGYQVEYRLPFQTIGASLDADGALQLGFNITRRIGRDRFETLSMAPVNTRESCDECQFAHAIWMSRFGRGSVVT